MRPLVAQGWTVEQFVRWMYAELKIAVGRTRAFEGGTSR